MDKQRVLVYCSLVTLYLKAAFIKVPEKLGNHGNCPLFSLKERTMKCQDSVGLGLEFNLLPIQHPAGVQCFISFAMVKNIANEELNDNKIGLYK